MTAMMRGVQTKSVNYDREENISAVSRGIDRIDRWIAN